MIGVNCNHFWQIVCLMDSFLYIQDIALNKQVKNVITSLWTLGTIESLGLRRATLMIAGADFVSIAEIETSIYIAIGGLAVAIWDICLKHILDSNRAKSSSSATYYQIVKYFWNCAQSRAPSFPCPTFFLNDMIIEIDILDERYIWV